MEILDTVPIPDSYNNTGLVEVLFSLWVEQEITQDEFFDTVAILHKQYILAKEGQEILVTFPKELQHVAELAHLNSYNYDNVTEQ